MALISGEEIADTLENIVKEVRDNPEFKLEYLYNAAAVLIAVGLIKKIHTLKVIGNYILSIPSKFRPLLAYKYQLLGAVEELEVKIGKQIEEALDETLGIISSIGEKLRQGELSETSFVEYMGKLEDLFSKMPTFKEE